MRRGTITDVTTRAPQIEEPDEHADKPGGRFGSWFPVVAFLGVAVPLFILFAVSQQWHFSDSVAEPSKLPHRWLAGWARWDGFWYWDISLNGYFYRGPGQQSSVAFFPAYPILLRIAGPVFGSGLVAGMVITFALGMGVAKTFYEWCRSKLPTASARTAVLVLLLYPFAWFLFGAVYSDALFLICAIGSFFLLDRDHPVLAGMVGAIATASRPVGLALIVGLALRAVERRGAVTFGGERATGVARLRPRFVLGRLRPGDAGVLLAAGGIGAYCWYLKATFGNAFAFVSVAGAPGWAHKADLDTWLKYEVWKLFSDPAYDIQHTRVAAQGVVTLLALALLPLVVRRFGLGYGAYACGIVVIPALATPDFIGMGRYLLAAFPCFAAAGHVLSNRPSARTVVLATGALGMACFGSLFSRWYFVT